MWYFFANASNAPPFLIIGQNSLIIYYKLKLFKQCDKDNQKSSIDPMNYDNRTALQQS